MAFREKLKNKEMGRNGRQTGLVKSFSGTEKRHDNEGNPIQHGFHYKIKFADEIDDGEHSRKSLATTYNVESYKRYNAPT